MTGAENLRFVNGHTLDISGKIDGVFGATMFIGLTAEVKRCQRAVFRYLMSFFVICILISMFQKQEIQLFTVNVILSLIPLRKNQKAKV